MASRRVLAPLAVASALGVALTVGEARAEPSAADRETARQLMEDGRALRDKNDLQGALQRFKAADADNDGTLTRQELRTKAGRQLLRLLR